MELLSVSNISSFQIVTTLTIFAIAIVLITTERLPNAITAMVGAFLLVAFHIMTQHEAISYIDFDTIGLLCGMMITVSILRRSGLFEYVAIKGIKFTGGQPWRILVVLSIVTAILSAFLDNVTTVLIIVPLTFAVADSLQMNPLPFLVSEVVFSNIGGAATLIGDPPNIMIGGATHLNFTDFIINNTPVIVIVCIAVFAYLRLVYYDRINVAKVDVARLEAFDETRAITNKKLLVQSLVVFTLIIAGFVTHQFHHVSLASIALGGGFLLMLVTRQDPEEILKEVEWTTLFFFIGLFILIGGLEMVGVIHHISALMLDISGGDHRIASQLVLWISALSTTVVNSIPFTAIMISVIKDMSASITGNPDALWWALSLGACLGGNGTLIGAAANIIVAGFSQKTKYPLRFAEYFKVGIPVMLISVSIVSVYLWFRYTWFQ